MSVDFEQESRETVADEIKICPLCGGRVFWFPISNYWGCENCKNTFNRYTVFPDEVKKTSAVGNAAAMRDIVTALANVVLPPRGKADEDGWLAWVRAMQAKARAALADATTEKSSAVGNAAAMREALLTLRDAARMFCHQILNSKYNDMMDEYKCRERGFPALLDLRYAIPKANFALSAPPRNCDVGTADSQIARFNEFCDSEWQNSGSANCGNCPLWVSGRIGHDCQIRWEQMPYTAEEGGAE